MGNVFLSIVNISITASWLILAVIVFRALFNKAPKRIICALWGLVAVRLLIPIKLESMLSLVPRIIWTPSIKYDSIPRINSDIRVLNEQATQYAGTQPSPNSRVAGMSFWNIDIEIFAIIWAVGVAIMLTYSMFSYFSLRKRVAFAEQITEDIYESKGIHTPFVLGLYKPRIYLPIGLKGQTKECVVAHERAHISRLDHIWKPLGFMILSIYWFNPLCWIAYILLSRDIELACDEKVTIPMNRGQRVDYCQALLECSIEPKVASACPLAFAEVGVKSRIKSVVSYKQPTIWLILFAWICCGIVCVCFMTTPKTSAKETTGNGSNVKLEKNVDEISKKVNPENDLGEENQKTGNVAVTDEKNRHIIEQWAKAFCNRNTDIILSHITSAVKKDLMARQMLFIIKDYVYDDSISFGYSSPWPMWEEEVESYKIVYQNDEENVADILYYVWTSDPHVTVWRETIHFTTEGDSWNIVKESLNRFEHIASGNEFEMAYPFLEETLMDYRANGLGKVLEIQVLENNISDSKKLCNPKSAVTILLNLLDNENKVILKKVKGEDKEAAYINIYFMEDAASITVKMIQPWGKDGIWIPQEYEISK